MITLEEFIEVRMGYIENANEDWGVDTIVNAARPNLMGGSGQCVDAAIHKKVDIINNDKGKLKREIKNEVDGKDALDTNVIRCKRGDVVKTGGYKLCETILHTVGPQNDEDGKWPNTCSSSAINTLKSCYRKITDLAIEDAKIKKVAIPVISAGNYGFEFKLAFCIAISEIYNTLLERKRKDAELLEYTTLKKIYFIIPDQENYNIARKMLTKYKRTFKKEKRVVSHKTFESQLQLLKEIQLYDRQKGYFTITRAFRVFLILLRMFLFPHNYLKDVFGKENWEARRGFAEAFSIFKMILGITILWLLFKNVWPFHQDVFGGLMTYNLLDTITYLLALIVLADIQNPSANIIRSLFMLFLNYIEACFELAIIGYVWINKEISVREWLWYSLTNIDFTSGLIRIETLDNAWFLSINAGIKFFFITLVFGYFANSLKARKFREC